jgi:hypothetical protein
VVLSNVTSVEPTCSATVTLVNSYFEYFLCAVNHSVFFLFSEILVNSKTNSVWKAGDKYKRLKLAETLELIRDSGASVLYNGSLTEGFVKDIKNLGGIITTEDMNEYQ